MFNKKYIDEYLDLIKENPQKYEKDYQRYTDAVSKSTAIYQGKPVPGIYQGIFYEEKDLNHWREIGKMMINIGNKMTDEYLKNPEYRKTFNFPDLMEKLILHDPGYDFNIPMARIDFFYDNEDNFMLCECNTDGSSAMHEDNTMGKLLLESDIMKDFSKRYSLSSRDFFQPWVDKTLASYEKINKRKAKTIAIADFAESGTVYEFEVFKEYYEKAGVKALIVDLRDFKFADGKLMAEGEAIDMIYRRVTTTELIEKANEAQEFIEAYLNNAFTTFGSFRSQIFHNKNAFTLMHDKRFSHIFTEEENKFIKNHIPFTKVLSNEDIEEILENKDNYIIKPQDGRGGHGVYAGGDFSKEEYRKKIEEQLKLGPTIVQKFYSAEKVPLPFFENGELIIEKMIPLYGLFVYFGESQGVYTRVGGQRIISGRTSYYTAPHIEVKNV